MSLAYAAVALLWIYASDRLVSLVLHDPEKIVTWSTIKGELFVLVTACLLYLLVSRLLGETREDRETAAPRRLPLWPPLLVFAGLTGAVLVLGTVALGGTGDAERSRLALVAVLVAVIVVAAAAATDLWWKGMKARAALAELRGLVKERALEKHRDALARWSNDSILLMASDGRIVEANERAAEVYGYPREELVGRNVRDIRAPEVREELDTDMEETRRKGYALFETRHARRDGTTFPVEISTRLLDVDGETWVQGVVRDITDRRRAEEQIARLTSLNTALGQINQAIVRATDRDALFDEICRIAVEMGRFLFAWVGVVDPATGRVVLKAKAGDDRGYLDGIRVTVDPEDPGGRGPTGTAIREDRACVVSDFLNDPMTAPWRDAAARAGVGGSASFPLKSGERPDAALTVYAPVVGFFDEKVLVLLREIADDISYALSHLEREKRRRAAEESLRESEAMLRESQRIARLGRYVLDATTGVWSSSEILDEIFGIGPDYPRDVAGWTALLHPDDREEMSRYLAQEVLGAGARFEHEYRIVRPDGEERWVLGLGELLRDPGGRITRMVGTIQDITERRSSEERHRLWSQVLESSAEGIMITDARGTLVTVNPAFTQVTGYSAAEVVGRTPKILQSGQHPPEFYRAMWKTIGETGRWQGEVWSRRKSGEVYPEWLSITAVKGARGELTHFIGIFSDITEMKESADRIQYLATHDFLTGLPNRSLIGDLVREAVSFAARRGKGLGLLFMDLDHFKTINDSLGHLAGDALLQRVAERLGRCLRAGDTVARLGGDEFLVLLPEIERSGDAAHVAEKVLHEMAAPFVLPEGEVSVSASIGIAVHPEDGADAVTLTKNADAAMYHAKERGRNNYQFFTRDMNARAFEALAMETSLRRALERGELVLEYQPQVELKTGRIVGLEALVRWNHPDLGRVLPGRFIPVAEERGLIVPIGEWVLGTAARQVRAWIDAGLAPVPVAVNVSSLQLQSGNLAQRVEALLGEAGVSPKLLELELTESVVMREVDATLSALASIRAMGVTLSIDDFGSGFSSLSYLGRLPIDRLKIDQSFVRDVGKSASARAITSAIVSMARSLGLRVTAEGVETKEQLEFLGAQGCDEVQGYLLSRPLSAEVAGALLRRAGSLLPTGAAARAAGA